VGPELEVQVKLFASLREAVGQEEVTLRLPPGASTGDLLDLLGARYPALAAQRRSLAVAVNMELCRPGRLLQAGDEVALLPPVGGG
jgi:molybdopterin synthase catalytic subunit